MKKMVLSVLCGVAAATYAGLPVRVDLSGREDGIKLEQLETSENLRAFHPDYLKKNKEFVVIANGTAGTTRQFVPYTLSCVPSESGTVKLILKSTASKKDAVSRVLVDGLRVTGAAVVNPSFEELENGAPVGWQGKGVIRSLAADGKNSISVNYREEMSQFIHVTAGKRFTIVFQAREDTEAK